MTLRQLALVPVVLALVAGVEAAAGNGGPSPGVAVGWDGVVAPGGAVRYVALSGDGSTTVAAVRRDGGRVVRFRTIPGAFAVPIVSYDGTTEGISRDGRTLVLGTYVGAPEPGAETRFAVLSTRSLAVRRVITLRGSMSFDALSPDARWLYVTEYLPGGDVPRYRVRIVDVEKGRLLAGALADRRLKAQQMNGQPVTRTTTRDGVWAYTLYAKETGLPFVHALDTRGRRAFCIELPWRGAGALGTVRMRVEGGSLVLEQRGAGRLAVIDRTRFTVRALARPEV